MPFQLLNTNGAVVPGITIQQTTSCVTSAYSADQYVGGANHASTTNFSAGGFSMVANYSGGGSSPGGVSTFQQPVPTPTTATPIDSWAAVTE
jgi:hypothetical protein